LITREEYAKLANDTVDELFDHYKDQLSEVPFQDEMKLAIHFGLLANLTLMQKLGIAEAYTTTE